MPFSFCFKAYRGTGDLALGVNLYLKKNSKKTKQRTPIVLTLRSRDAPIAEERARLINMESRFSCCFLFILIFVFVLSAR